MMQLTRKNKILLDTIIRLIRRNAQATLQKVITKVHPADIALVMDNLRSSEAKILFHNLDTTETAAEVLSEVSYATAAELLETLKPATIAEILTEMASDDAAEILSDLTEELRDEVLKLMEDKDSDLVEELLSYSEETAGRIMTPEFLALKADDLVEDAIREVQKSSDTEMVFYVYVVDEGEHLLGVISLRQLLTVSPKKKLKEIMISDVIRVRTDEDQEEVARIVARYNLLAIPVVNDRNKLVGIVTVDDIIDVISEEAVEDMMRMSGASQQDWEALNVVTATRLRFPWILSSLVAGFIAFWLLNHYQSTPQVTFILLSFIPLILGIAGNVANQSGTMIAQGLVSGAIPEQRLWKVMTREFIISCLLALVYGVVSGGLTWLFVIHQINTAVAIGVALALVLIISATVGASIPFLFYRLNLDPAIASGPITMSLIDLFALAIYLPLALAILSP